MSITDWLFGKKKQPAVMKAAAEEQVTTTEPVSPVEEQYVKDCLRHKYDESLEARSWDSDPVFRKVLDPLNSGDRLSSPTISK